MQCERELYIEREIKNDKLYIILYILKIAYYCYIVQLSNIYIYIYKYRRVKYI